ncbi:MAG: hypothetical protein M1522_04570, partial [Actinobacteria bacterium]|nr:hypothetical protein [Actinomycetota bacterium]
MSEPCWAQISFAPWDEARTDEAFVALSEAIVEYGFEEDATDIDGDVSIRALTDSQANYGSAAFDELRSLAKEAGLWCATTDADGYDWAGGLRVYKPDGCCAFDSQISHDTPVLDYSADPSNTATVRRRTVWPSRV